MNQLSNNKNYIGSNELFLLDNLNNYNKSIVSKFHKYFKSNFQVLDFGAGIGTLLKQYNILYKIKPHALEIDNHQANIIRESGFFCFDFIEQIDDNTYDLIYSSNVFEHIENDNKELIKLVNKLKIGGHVCLYLPAFNFLWTDLDNKVLHYRRYNKKNISQLIRNTNLEIIEYKYCDTIGALFTLIFKFFHFDMKNANPITLKIFDKYFFPFNILVEKLFFFKFGKNIFVTLKKTK